MWISERVKKMIIKKQTGSRIIYDENPRRLIQRCVADYRANPPHVRDRGAGGK